MQEEAFMQLQLQGQEMQMVCYEKQIKRSSTVTVEMECPSAQRMPVQILYDDPMVLEASRNFQTLQIEASIQPSEKAKGVSLTGSRNADETTFSGEDTLLNVQQDVNLQQHREGHQKERQISSWEPQVEGQADNKLMEETEGGQTNDLTLSQDEQLVVGQATVRASDIGIYQNGDQG